MSAKELEILDIFPSCQYSSECGGCDYIGKSYLESLDAKLDEFKNTMMCLKGIDHILKDIKIIPSANPLNWRTRCQLQIKKGKLGFFKKKTHELIEINECIMLDKRINARIKELNFPQTVDGKIELYIKNGKVCERFVEQKYQNLFLQVNEEVNEQLINDVLIFSEPQQSDNFLELFCGLGNFTYKIAKKAKIVGIDIQTPKTNKDKNIEFVEMDALKGVLDLKNKNRLPTFNKILLDPPRAGAGARVFNELLNSRKFDNIVYVSCNVESFVSDAQLLLNNSYSLKKISLLDMFPFSKYVESVNLFV